MGNTCVRTSSGGVTPGALHILRIQPSDRCAMIKVSFRHEQHPTNKIGCGNPFGTLAFLIPAICFDQMISVYTFCSAGDVVTVYTEVTLMLIQCLQGGDIGSCLDHFV